MQPHDKFDLIHWRKRKPSVFKKTLSMKQTSHSDDINVLCLYELSNEVTSPPQKGISQDIRISARKPRT